MRFTSFHIWSSAIVNHFCVVFLSNQLEYITRIRIELSSARPCSWGLLQQRWYVTAFIWMKLESFILKSCWWHAWSVCCLLTHLLTNDYSLPSPPLHKWLYSLPSPTLPKYDFSLNHRFLCSVHFIYIYNIYICIWIYFCTHVADLNWKDFFFSGML